MKGQETIFRLINIPLRSFSSISHLSSKPPRSLGHVTNAWTTDQHRGAPFGFVLSWTCLRISSFSTAPLTLRHIFSLDTSDSPGQKVEWILLLFPVEGKEDKKDLGIYLKLVDSEGPVSHIWFSSH